jgi:hypothetical protein
MNTQPGPNLEQKQDPGVQHDSETPLPQKPSVLFISTTVGIIITFILVVVLSYNGLTH